jgi:large subunit ribosomal protein L33
VGEHSHGKGKAGSSILPSGSVKVINKKNMATKTKRPFLKMECDVCKKANYHIQIKKGKTIEEKLELKKHCKWCKVHTLHKMKLK